MWADLDVTSILLGALLGASIMALVVLRLSRRCTCWPEENE